LAISRETIEEVQRTANVYDVISEYLELKRAGSSYTTRCPFHSEKTPSFMVSPQKNIWKCFGCGKSGDALKFIMEYEGLSFADAIIKLANKYGIQVKFTKTDEKDKLLSGLFNITKELSEFYKEQLKNHTEPRKYLDKRGLLPSVIDKFDIGYSPDDPEKFEQFIKEKNIPIENLSKIGTISIKEDGKIRDKFYKRIIFPIKDYKGRVVGFGGRRLDDGLPKYINSPESEIYQKSKVLYGYYESRDYIRETKEVVVVEGYFDVISLHQIGIKNVVATSGTALTKEHGKLISKFATDVILMFDSDSAGKKAAISASKILLTEGLNVKYCPLPEGEDPDSISKKGYTEVKKLIDNSITIFEFLIKKIKELNLSEENENNNEKLLKKKKELINLYITLANKVKDKIERGILIQYLSDTTGFLVDYFDGLESEVEESSADKESEDSLENLTLNEKIVLKGLLENKEEILSKFNKFDKIDGSVYFKYLLDMILQNPDTKEYEEIDKIRQLPVKSDVDSVLYALELLHKRWIQKEIEAGTFLAMDDDRALLETLEKKKNLINRRT